MKDFLAALILSLVVSYVPTSDAAIYNVKACDSVIAFIIEREIDGRHVSRAFFANLNDKNEMYYKIPDHMKTWVKEGIEESVDDNQVFVFELDGVICLTEDGIKA